MHPNPASQPLMINKLKGLIFAEACLDNRPAEEQVSLRLCSNAT